MAKRMKAGPLDESLIIQSFKDADLLAIPQMPCCRRPESVRRHCVGRRGAGGGRGRRTDRRHREGQVPAAAGEADDEVYLKRRELKTRQPVYISQEIHRSIIKLVHLLALAGKEISVGGYIDNVLAEHLRQHKDEIAELYRSGIDDILQTDH